jgi:RHS repeat-associated protein
MAKTIGKTDEGLIDINGDGLPDYISISNKTVRFNTGSGFSNPINWVGIDQLDQSESVGESANIGFTIGIAIPVLGIKILINPSGSASHGVSRPTTELGDFNFDGFPDYVSSSNESVINYKASTINRTNMLMAVNRPFGSKFTMNYIQSPATYEHPGGKWVLDSVKMFDGLTGDGADTTLTTYKYDKGYYDRHERQFFGFETVSTSYHNTSEKGSPVYRTTITHFDNKSYYTKGLVLSETLVDANGRKQTGYENSYSPINIYSGEILNSSEFQNDSMSIFPALVSTKQFIYEGSNEPKLTTSLSYSYDLYGNIKNYTDYDSGDEKDLLKVDIGYHSVADKYIYSVPKQQDVTTSAGLIRQRKTEIDSLGEMTSISQLLSEGKIANYNLEYDSYGNLSKITRPENETQQRLFYKYIYDPDIHSLVTGISDAYGYSSSTSYNYLWGTPLETIDKNAEKVRYTYDNRGRVKTVTGPYELAGSNHYTISVNYFTDAVVPYAQTLHYDSANNSDIETFTFVDGLGRPIQIKKTSVVYNKKDSSESQGYSVSGKTIYDAFGRETAVYQHVFEAPGNAGKYNSTPDAVAPTTATYDVLDRITSVTLPDGAVIKHSYGISNYSNVNSQYDSTINPLGQIKLTYFDTKYRKLAEILSSDNGEVKTSYKYNPIGELLEIVDPKGNKTVFTYDLNGRRLSINHPDAGLTEFAYNPAGGLISKKTANLRKQIPGGGEITYKHDYERIKEVDYPRNVQNKVEYSYGQAGERFGRVGRLRLIQDATGGQEFYYGHLGEVVKTIRTIVLAKNDMRTWIWSATYDTWNRVQTMTYPDDEVINYKYNAAGNLKSLSGSKRGRNYKYIDQIGYDKEEKQVIMKYGNGTKVDYSYEPNRQNLTEMTLVSGSQKLMDNVYSYDALSNLLSVTNDVKPSGKIGGSTSHSYSYDGLNRLVSANGRCISSDTSAYTLSMKYDIMGNILNKKQSLLVNGKKQKASSYDFDYKYDAVKPDAPDWIDSTQYLYDENGNLTYYEDSTSGTSRQLSWNEDNQLSMISDDGYVSNYTYDAFENRVIKSHGGTQGLYLNGAPVGLINHSDANYTVYVNPYFTLNSKTFTKHFYNGTKRIASKIGNGKFENQFRSGIFEITAGSVNYINRQQQFEKGKEDYYASLKLPPGPPTMKGAYSDPLTSGKAIPNTEATNTDVPPGWPSVIVYAEAGGPPGAPIHYGDSITNETAKAGFGYFGTGDAEETQCYYLHSDQLGSVNYVTDNIGKISQFVAYLPFGETLKEKHSNYNNSWKFNGKELDDETGLYCFGNRYYDPKISLFYTTAIQDFNRPAQSPYIYAADNPVFFIDSSTISTLATKTSKAVDIIEKSRSKTAQGQVKASWSISNDPELNFDTKEINSEEKDEDKDKDDNKQKNKKKTDNASEKNDNSDTKGETIDLIDNLLPDINSGGSNEGGGLKDNIKNAVKGAAIKAARTVIKDVLKDGVKATVKNYIDKGKNAINKIKSMPGKLLKGFENKMKKEKDKILK